VLVTLQDIQAARDRIAGLVHRTPMFSSRSLGDMCGGVRLHLKAELFQKTGSFKPRGILSKVLSLTDEERARGVVSLSSGNAAAALAYAGSIAGCRATVCMPSSAVPAKVEATRAYGGEVVLVQGDLLEGFERVREQRGLVVVHPFADPHVIAGQGTLGLEIAEDVPDADVVVIPVGGGGLISGVAAAVKATIPAARVIGVEPAGADIMRRSLAAGRALRLPDMRSVADGLSPPMTEEINLAHVKEHVDEVVAVEDDAILRALGLLVRRSKLAAEPSGAAGLAALLEGSVDVRQDSRVVVVVSGGNADLSLLSKL
jgi:threonine dehydratase